MIFQFDAVQLAPLIGLAESRNTFKAGARAKNRKIADNQSAFEVMLSGLMGEFAVSRVLKVPFNSAHHLGGDGGSDLNIKGKRVQIKTSKTDSLIFNRDDRRLKADVCVLVQTLGPSRVEIHGWCTRGEFYSQCQERDFGYGMRDVVEAHKLQPIDTLFEVDELTSHEARFKMDVLLRDRARRMTS